MFLRALTIRGFKSFADKTAFEFTPGVSVIVGPNGSGKSNIVDAIAWVLGEQGARALRGGQMTDVIFAGTSSRPALGMAEVKLVIDNSAGLIPVPASEIEISRAVFRSGESEYRIGGRPCRLIDLQELLSDTGIGRALHTIVGQGQLDSVLGARPEERRQFIEEAAGIAKHRRRRERAERKLAGLEQDLLRLQDLVGELRRQLKPLKQQAELARRHEALSNEAGELAAKLAAARLRDLYADREMRRPSWERAEARQIELRADLDRLDSEIDGLDLARREAEEAERAAQESHSSTSRARTVAEEALRSALKVEAGARDRLGSVTNRSGRLFALEEELERTERAFVEVEASLERRSAELEEGEAEFRRASQVRRDAEEDRRRQAEDAAVRRAELEATQRALAGHEAELERLFGHLRDLARRKTEAQARRTALEKEVESLDARGTPVAAQLSALDREGAQRSARVAELAAEEQGLIARQEVVEASRRELSISPGSEFVQRPGSRPIGLLRDLIEASPEHATSLRGALGQWFDAVVYTRAEDAIADASAAGSGGLTMLVDAPDESAGDDAAAAGAGRRLVDLVRPDPRVRALVYRLLAGVFVVTNLAEAAARSRANPRAQFVTKAGEVVGASFVRTAPGHDARLDRVRRESASIDRELAAIRRGMREHRQGLLEQADRADSFRGELEQIDRLITAAAEEMGGLEAQLTSLTREEQLVQQRVAAVEAAALAVRDLLASGPPMPSASTPLPPIAEPPVHARVEVEALKRERSRLEAGVTRARRQIETLASEDPIALREALSTAEESRESAESSLAAADAALAGAMDDYRRATEAARRTQSRHAEAYRSWRDRASAGERLREEHAEQDRARAELERRISETERMLVEGHRSDPAAAVAALTREETVEDLQRRSDLIARRLGLVGRVNLLATDELDSLRERHDFLVRELEDVKAARRDLQEVIADVDRRVAEQFEAAFSDVAREFASLFELMFPGGEGRLSLVDPGDPLTTGIEVEARPSRGRVKRLSLLSGGERSLAALAFLFAIFRARPSPFYLMDEVEAALDDVNLHRFLELVRAFARDSQILIVSHQKRTMEAADVLYGISMGPAGVSTVISERLLEAAAPR